MMLLNSNKDHSSFKRAPWEESCNLRSRDFLAPEVRLDQQWQTSMTVFGVFITRMRNMCIVGNAILVP